MVNKKRELKFKTDKKHKLYIYIYVLEKDGLRGFFMLTPLFWV